MTRKPVLYGLFATLLGVGACQEAAVAPIAAASTTSAQASADADGVRSGPVARIVANAAELGLTSDQVARLTSIGDALEAKNAPLREQVKAIVGERPERGARPQMTEAEREAMRAKMEQARPILEQVRENSRAAFEEARAVLTADQQARIRERGPEGRDGRRGRGGSGGRAG